MSRYNSLKTGISFLIVLALFMAVISAAQAVQAAKAQPTAVSSDDVTQHAGKDKNVTSATPVSPGQLKLGKITAPPIATFQNLTATAKANASTVIDNARLTVAKKTASVKISLVIRQLEQYKKQIARSSLSPDEKAAIIALADNNIAWYRQQDSAIQAAGDLETINALANETNQQTDLLKVNMKKDAGIMACDQLDERIAMALSASAIAAGKVSVLDASGNDIDALESSLADYNVHVDVASQYSMAARTAFESISSEANVDSGFYAGYQQIKLADLEMGKAYADLKDFYRLYLINSRIK
jgi:hypothetical protein